MKNGEVKQEGIISSITRLKSELKTVTLAEPLPAMSFGVLSFDRITGGGLPVGRMTELFGDWSSGKSVVAYQAIAVVQKLGGVAILHDSEGSLNEPWAENLGIDLNTLLYYEPMPLEDVFASMDEAVVMIREDAVFKDAPILVVWDSVAGTASRSEEEGDYGKQEIAVRARISSKAMSKLTGVIRRTRSVFLFINQLRDKPMVMFGDTEETTGGRAIKFHASLRLHMKKRMGQKGKLLDVNRVVGMTGSLQVKKSKVCPPFQIADFELYYKTGIPRLSGLLGVCVADGLVKSSGGWFSIGEEKFRSTEFTEDLYNKAISGGKK